MMGIGGVSGFKISKNDLAKITDLKDNDKVYDALRKKATSRGIHVNDNFIHFGPSGTASAYAHAKDYKSARDIIAKELKKARKSGNPKDLENALKLRREKLGNPSTKIGNLVGKKNIIQVDTPSAALISHELGHADYKNGKGGLIGRAAHKLYHPSKLASTYGTPLLALEGFRRGKNSVKTDEDGTIKVNKKKALKSAAIGAAVAAPMLIAEAAASRRGLKHLRDSGASKELIKQAKKDLKTAWGTYASSGLLPVTSELAGHAAGIAYGKTREEKRRKKK